LLNKVEFKQNQFHLGGEELKLPILALLFFGAGLLVQIPQISAQDNSSQGEGALSQQAQERDPRAWERSVSFEGNDGANAAPGGAASGPSTWAIVRMLLTLALAAAAIYGLVYFFKRAAKPSAAIDPFLKILATTHLGANRYAHIVNVGDKAWLLGSSDGGVNLIGEIDNKEVINAMLLEESRKSALTSDSRFPDFLGMLRRLGVRTEAQIPGADEIRRRRERLKGL